MKVAEAMRRQYQTIGPRESVQAAAQTLAERLSGRPLEVQAVPQPALEAQRASAPDALSRSFAALQLAVSRGSVIDMRETLRRFPIRLTSVETHLERTLGRRVGAGAPG